MSVRMLVVDDEVRHSECRCCTLYTLIKDTYRYHDSLLTPPHDNIFLDKYEVAVRLLRRNTNRFVWHNYRRIGNVLY